MTPRTMLPALAALALGAAIAAPALGGSLLSPSHAIGCDVGGIMATPAGDVTGIICQVASPTYVPPARPADCDPAVPWGDVIALTPESAPHMICHFNPTYAFMAADQQAGFVQKWKWGGFEMGSLSHGVGCGPAKKPAQGVSCFEYKGLGRGPNGTQRRKILHAFTMAPGAYRIIR